MQDHYKILHIPSTASADEIKKAFRKLALLYHPDKNKASLAQKQFAEIQEAYSVLKDPAKRAAYHYQRFTAGHRHNQKPPAHTAMEVLEASTLLRNKLLRLDPFRIDLDLLSFEIKEVLSDHNMELLLQAEDTNINRQVVANTVHALQLVPLFLSADSIALLQRLGEKDNVIQKEINSFLQNAKREHYWNKYKILIALLLAVLFCLAIYLSVKKQA